MTPTPEPRPLSLADRVEIAPGVLMPRLGLGTYKSAPGVEASDSVRDALELGYRGIDTAALYANEADIGRAVAESGIPRDEVFIATKVWNTDQGYETTLAAFDASLDMDYVDLYLMHWPQPTTIPETWRAMEEIHASGRARAIGVCNFLPAHLDELLGYAKVPPAVDQVEHNPLLQQPELREYCASHGITMQAWAPVIRGRAFDVPELIEIGARHGKSPAQISIRWILQHGVTTIPKSVHRERIAGNADVFDFELSAEEMSLIDTLDAGMRMGPDPNVMRRQGHR